MRGIRFAVAVLASAVAACAGGELEEPAAKDAPVVDSVEVDSGAASSFEKVGRAPALEVDASLPDAATDWVYDAGGPQDECTQSVFTQVLCYGTSAPSSGTSRGGTCDDAGVTQGCTLRVDPAGANPNVWCCP